MIFSKKGTKALIWMNDNWGDSPLFATLADLVGVKLFYIKVKSLDDKYHGPYLIDAHTFQKQLETFHTM
jgi:hypothetical protein